MSKFPYEHVYVLVYEFNGHVGILVYATKELAEIDQREFGGRILAREVHTAK